MEVDTLLPRVKLVLALQTMTGLVSVLITREMNLSVHMNIIISSWIINIILIIIYSILKKRCNMDSKGLVILSRLCLGLAVIPIYVLFFGVIVKTFQ